MNKQIVLIILTLTSNLSIGQISEGTSSNKFGEFPQDMPRLQVGFSLSPFLANKVNVTSIGEDWLKSRPVVGGVVGTTINVKVHKKIGISCGLNLGILPYNLNYGFDAKVENPSVTFSDHDLKDYAPIPFTGFQLSLSYLFNKVSIGKLTSVITLGVNRVTIPTFSYELGSSVGADRIFESEMTDFNDLNKEYFSVPSVQLKYGVQKPLKRQNTIQLNVLANISMEKMGKGTFMFSNLEEKSKGTMELNGNYVGIELVYGLAILKSN